MTRRQCVATHPTRLLELNRIQQEPEEKMLALFRQQQPLFRQGDVEDMFYAQQGEQLSVLGG